MNHIDTVFESSSKDIYNLTKNLINDDFQEKLLDSFMIKNRKKKSKKRKGNERFKSHPNLLTSSDSNVSGKTETLRNGYQKHQVVLCNCSEQICDVTLKENTLYLFTPRHTESSSTRSSSNGEEYINSPRVDFILKKDTKNVKLNNKVKDSIEPKQPEVEIKQHQTNVEAKKKRVDKKLFHLLQKTLSCLEDICLSLSNKMVLPDGQEDWQKRRIRNVEFSSRFQRNYLYQLGRQIIELQKAIRNLHDNHLHKSVSQCVLTAHQTLLQAFQAYHNHIPTCLGNVVVDKLKVVIDHARNLLGIHLKLLVPEDFDSAKKKNLIESISGRCGVILDKATEIMAQPIEHVPPKKPTIKSCRSTNKLPQKNNFTKRIESKLSMYSIPTTIRKREVWKKSLDVFSNDKFKNSHIVQSRYKTAGFKHRPPVEKNKLESVPTRNRLFQKKPYMRDTPLATPRNEDNIKTMIAMIKEEEEKEHSNDNHQVPLQNTLESLVPLLKSICEKIVANRNEVVNQGQLENVLKGLLDVTLNGTIDKELINDHICLPEEAQKNGFNHGVNNVTYKSLPNLLHKVESKIQNGKLKVENGKRHFETSNLALNLTNDNAKNMEHERVKVNEKNNNWQTVSVTGEKNAQLICIRDNSSTPEITLQQPTPSLATITRESTREAAQIEKEEKKETPKKKLHSIKISRLSKSTLRTLTPLPKLQIKGILQGKLLHAKYMKGNPMYCKTTKRHPWQIVDQMAESLLNEIVLSIAQEIQVNNILESLYNSEFQ